MPVDADILPTFLEEAAGYVEVLRRHETAEMGALHQAAHSLKGAAAMLGLTRLEGHARRLEEQLRQGQVDALPGALGAIEGQLEHLRRSGTELEEPGPPPTTGDASVLEEDWDPETAAMLRDLFADEAAEHMEAITAAMMRLGRQPTDRSPIQDVLRKAHTLKGSASTVGLPRISEAAHQLEERLVELEGEPLSGAVVTQLHRAVEQLRRMVEGTRGGDASAEQLELLTSRLRQAGSGGRAAPDALPARDVRPLGREAREGWDRLPPRRRAISRPDRRVGLSRRQDDVLRVRVDVNRLDFLMNAVGELVIQRTRIEQRVEELKGLARDMTISRRDLHAALANVTESDPALTRIREVDVEVADAVSNLERAAAFLEEDSEALRRTTHTLQESLTEVRMMPIRWLHARLQRPMRELAAVQDKLVELITDDESTEMDRLVFEQITDPLIHLIRNAVAHGVETPEQRAAAGKPEVGQIRVGARQKGDLVIVEVEDDGAGLDSAALRGALSKRVSPEAVERMSDAEVTEAIFATGFTTRARADRLAGRGMGLDVVRRNIADMGGEIQVSSTPGRGTRFTIRMPITTAIIQALLFKVGEPVYAIPVGYVVETLFVDPPTGVKEIEGQLHVQARGRWIPLLQLHDVLGGDTPLPLVGSRDGQRRPTTARQPVMVLIYGDQQFGVSCTRVVGPREIVLKQLGPVLAGLPLFSGATISGSSKVQFVLDVAVLARLASHPHAPLAEPSPSKRVLVVDDSRSVRAAVGHILRMAGYSVDVAADGWEAWERLQVRSYDLLLTDLEMPRLHGHDLIARCRRGGPLASLPILVLTSRTAEGNRERSLRLGANDFLPKPINRRLVLEQVRRLVGEADAPR